MQAFELLFKDVFPADLQIKKLRPVGKALKNLFHVYFNPAPYAVSINFLFVLDKPMKM